MGQKRWLRDIKRRNIEAKVAYFATTYGKIFAVKPTYEEEMKQIERFWSSLQLPSPPLFTGKNFDHIWPIRIH